MRIEAVRAFTSNNNLKNAALTKQNTAKQTQNAYKLPNYAVSFGMAKAKINFSHNSAYEIEKKAEIQEAVEKSLLLDDSMEILEGLVQKYADDKDALKYIFESSDIEDDETGENFAAAYLCALRNNAEEQDWEKGEWNQFMTELLCDSKNQTGKTIPHIFASNALMLEAVFSAADDHPDILYEILTSTDSQGASIGTKAAYSGDKGAFKLLNEKLYYLAGHNKSLSTSEALYLLDTNKDVLDKANKRLMDSLLNNEFCEEFSNPDTY